MIRKNNYSIIFTAVILFFLIALGARAEMTEMPPINVQESLHGFLIFWAKPALSEAEDFVLIRKDGTCPDSLSDGTEIYVGKRPFFEDQDLGTGKAYCYGAFIYDHAGKFSAYQTSQIIEKKSRIKYLLYQIAGNSNLTLGLVVIMALFWINKITMNKKIENKKVIMRI
jgi:hypothetical protein